ncbi:MAG: tripartite tricarboxylate transporter TctB family protein [Spirochaetales bacterium]|nr:tripartite tricarboxylate transporter TctB family protein [Spirochaetales bacterium]
MKTLKINTRAVIPVLTFAVGALWFIYGLKSYGWWGNNGPASGFFPSIVGIILAGISIIAFVDGLKREAPEYFKASYHPLLAAIATVLAALVIGFFPALLLYILGWLKLYEKYNWKLALSISVITTAACYGIFVMWLQVPFPAGYVFDLILG